MSTKIEISPEELRALADAMRRANTRNLGAIESRMTTRNNRNEEIASDRSSRESTLYEHMFVQVDNAGLANLITSFNDSYHTIPSNRSTLNNVIGHMIPSSMTDLFMDSLPRVSRSDTRWFVGGNRWGGLLGSHSGATSALRRLYNNVSRQVQGVIDEVERHRDTLRNFETSGITSRHHTTSSGVANRAFISRLNYVSDDAVDVLVGVDERAGQTDAFVVTVRDVFYALQRNITTAKAIGEELATQADALAANAEALDRQSARLFNGGSINHASQLIRSVVDLTIYRPELLADGKGLESARDEQHEDRYETLERNLTTHLYEVADFIATPTRAGNNIASKCARAIADINAWEAFISGDVSVEIREAVGASNMSDPNHHSTAGVRHWRTRQSQGRNLASYLRGDIVDDIEVAKRVLINWETAFTHTTDRARRFTTAINNDVHVNRLSTQAERAIYPSSDFRALHTFATRVKTDLESQAATYDRFASMIRNNMDGVAMRAYANALERGATYFRAIIQTIEADFWEGIGSNDSNGKILSDLGKGLGKKISTKSPGVLSWLGGSLTIRQGTLGASGAGQFVIVNTNGSGSWLSRLSRNPRFGQAVRWGGRAIIGLNFVSGVWSDVSSGNRTTGHAISFNAGRVATGTAGGIAGGAIGGGVATTIGLASNPIGWKIAGGVALGWLANQGYNLAYNNNFLGFQTFVHAVGDGLDFIGQGLANAWNSTTNAVGNAWNSTTNAVGNAWNSTTNAVGNAWNSTTNAVGSAWNSMTNAVGSAWNSTTNAVSNLGSTLNPFNWSWGR